ncbi:hypothetical protein SPAB_04057 [Salmonella enterica subsp. enterica serovar Paratyphi B str. SPB7]|uniref:Uncharacterized protein n=1 Tax=Salmonella paratyphi B (strain ATCC BAA-1250 / SPB7) TaxID=1016998 RepID=A0A6C6Z764_SALPB|nr:hypothetical protein SPAB_04057 [Salmonella enterica subsp. enterica serovar Paratyphi B str. SPB7]
MHTFTLYPAYIKNFIICGDLDHILIFILLSFLFHYA